MRFYEFESKRLSASTASRCPPGRGSRTRPSEAATITGEINGPVVLKSQVLTGGRMKAGGVLFADAPARRARPRRSSSSTINGHRPAGVLVEGARRWSRSTTSASPGTASRACRS